MKTVGSRRMLGNKDYLGQFPKEAYFGKTTSDQFSDVDGEDYEINCIVWLIVNRMSIKKSRQF